MPKVKFLKSIYPHMKGDIVEIDELKYEGNKKDVELVVEKTTTKKTTTKTAVKVEVDADLEIKDVVESENKAILKTKITK